MSETATTAQVQTESTQPIEQSYVYAQNLASTEFPVTITVLDILNLVPPIMVTLSQNGFVPLGDTGDAHKTRLLTRVQIANASNVSPPLVVDTYILNPLSVEPPITVTSQYIRVVIRNYQIPQTEKPHDI
jgi:hypothetical protein